MSKEVRNHDAVYDQDHLEGQVTIPKAIRDLYGLAEGDYLILEPKGETLVVRKGRLVGSEEDFEELADRIAERLEERGISRADVKDAVRWARGSS